MQPIILPELGTSQARLGLWLVELGESVYEGERIAEVLIPGASVDIISPSSGRLQARYVGANQPLEPGQVLGTLQSDQDD